jgi:hypothetical protein
MRWDRSSQQIAAARADVKNGGDADFVIKPQTVRGPVEAHERMLVGAPETGHVSHSPQV